MELKKNISKYKSLVVKSNYIIEASYKLSLQEQRIIYILITKINQDDERFKPYKLTVREFADIVCVKNKNIYTEVAKHVDSLRHRDLTIIKEKSVLKTTWLSSAEYFTDEGTVELEFSPKLKPYLLQLKERFTKLDLKKVVSFSSNYSCRVYELLKQYEKVRERTLKIEDLRTMFCIEPNEYKLYADFKRKVIIQAQKEINSKTDISFQFDEIKIGRKVTSIKFIIESSGNITNLKNELVTPDIAKEMNSGELELIKQVQAIFYNHKITELEAKQILKTSKNDIEIIKQKYEIICQTNNIKNIVGATIQAIKEDWQEQKQSSNSTFNSFKQRDYSTEQFKYIENKLLGWE